MMDRAGVFSCSTSYSLLSTVLNLCWSSLSPGSSCVTHTHTAKMFLHNLGFPKLKAEAAAAAGKELSAALLGLEDSYSLQTLLADGNKASLHFELPSLNSRYPFKSQPSNSSERSLLNKLLDSAGTEARAAIPDEPVRNPFIRQVVFPKHLLLKGQAE